MYPSMRYLAHVAAPLDEDRLVDLRDGRVVLLLRRGEELRLVQTGGPLCRRARLLPAILCGGPRSAAVKRIAVCDAQIVRKNTFHDTVNFVGTRIRPIMRYLLGSAARKVYNFRPLEPKAGFLARLAIPPIPSLIRQKCWLL